MSIADVKVMQEEAAEPLGDALKVEVEEALSEVWVLNDWCDSDVLYDVCEDASQGAIVLQRVLEPAEPVLEVTEFSNSPLGEGEPFWT